MGMSTRRSIDKIRNCYYNIKRKVKKDVANEKLPHIGNRAADVEKYLKLSLQRLQLEYLDLYLIHMPFGLMPDPSGEAPATEADGSITLDFDTDHVTVWKEMELQVDAGRTKSIGLSNFNERQVKRILEVSRIKPAMVQVEIHAYLQQPQFRAFCSANNISLTAFSPLGSPGSKIHFKNKYNYDLSSTDSLPQLLNHPAIQELCTKHNKTPAQILLRHLVQQGIAVIPKSANNTRIAENSQIFDFELPEDHMAKLNAMDVGEEARIINFMFFKGVENHPEYPFKLTPGAILTAPTPVESVTSQISEPDNAESFLVPS